MRNKTKRIALILSIFFILGLTAGGCLRTPQPEDKNPPLDPTPGNEEFTSTEVVLYFADDQAMYLMPEKRVVKIKNAGDIPSLAGAIVNELIKGPADKTLRLTIPPESKLLSVEIKDKIAYVNFTEEIRSKHWGGSAGETMTIMSIVNSLTELDGIDKVQLLIEGEVQDSLIGHWYIGEPIERNEDLLS